MIYTEKQKTGSNLLCKKPSGSDSSADQSLEKPKIEKPAPSPNTLGKFPIPKERKEKKKDPTIKFRRLLQLISKLSHTKHYWNIMADNSVRITYLLMLSSRLFILATALVSTQTLVLIKEPATLWILQRGIQTSFTCFLCHQETDTNDHLFLNCVITRQLWQLFITLASIVWMMPKEDVGLICSWNSIRGRTCHKEWWKIAPACIRWTVWKEMNAKCFEGKSTSTQKIKIHAFLFFIFGLKNNW